MAWSEKSLEEVVAKFIDYRGKTPRKVDFGIPLITAKIVKGGRVDRYGEFIEETEYSSWMKRGIPNPGDTIITTEAPLGEVAEVPSQKVAFAQRIIVLSPNRDLLVPRYLKYAMISPGVQFDLRARASGTTVQGIKQTELRKVKIPVPDLLTQQRIAHVLGCLDDKIEVNRKMNETLEQMTRAIFKSWFIDFDPVHAKRQGKKPSGMDKATAALFPDCFEQSEFGQVPMGWTTGSLADVFSVNTWTLSSKDTLCDIDYIEISSVGAGAVNEVVRYQKGSEPSRAKRRLRHLDTVVSTVRPERAAYFLAVHPSESTLASTGFAVLTPKSECEALFGHYAVARDEFFEELGRLADGGAYPAINPQLILSRPLVIPPPALRNAFHSVTEPIAMQKYLNDAESKTLAQTRDLLLPRLLSGDLIIKEPI